MCNTPKYAKLEERTGNVYSLPGFVLHLNIWLLIFLKFCCRLCLSGYGGGFNERENVEYIEREESDGEYDEVSPTLKCNT